MRTLLWLVAVGLYLVAPAEAQETTSLPSSVTEAMISAGETYYKTIGLCFACHGPNATGLPGVGVNLLDEEWLHTDGSFDGVVHRILIGVGPEETKTGVIMPPKGGSQITEEQARAIAGYVLWLSEGRGVS